jgi:hypothetical protein
LANRVGESVAATPMRAIFAMVFISDVLRFNVKKTKYKNSNQLAFDLI